MKIIVQRIHPVLLIMSILSIFACSNGKFSYPDPGICIEDLEGTVRYLTELKPPRNHNHPGSMKRSAEFIAQKLREYGLKPERQEFEAAGKIYENILASAGPREGSRVIVGAHYDVCGSQPGADDNASAIAGLLEIARFAKEHESELPYRVDFVAYALEEPPFFKTNEMGSYIHAESLRKDNIKVKGMICLEMIGYFSDRENSQSYPISLLKLFYPSVGNFIGVISNLGSSSFAAQVSRHLQAASINVKKLRAPAFIEGIDFSDHRNYWKFGYDAVMITDTAFYRNPNYHEGSDSLGTLDFERMREVIKGVCWSILNVK